METIRAILRPIQPDRRGVSVAFFVVAAGATTVIGAIGACAYLIAATALPTTATATAVSALPSEFTTSQSFTFLSEKGGPQRQYA